MGVLVYVVYVKGVFCLLDVHHFSLGGGIELVLMFTDSDSSHIWGVSVAKSCTGGKRT